MTGRKATKTRSLAILSQLNYDEQGRSIRMPPVEEVDRHAEIERADEADPRISQNAEEVLDIGVQPEIGPEKSVRDLPAVLGIPQVVGGKEKLPGRKRRQEASANGTDDQDFQQRLATLSAKWGEEVGEMYIFHAEKILHTMQDAGMRVVSEQYLCDDPELPKQPQHPHAFIRKYTAELENVISTYLAIGEGTASVDRFKNVNVSELPQNVDDTYMADINPLYRGRFTPTAFGEFNLESVSAEAKQVKEFNLNKYHEFQSLYRIGSYLFDSACVLSMHVQLSHITPEETKSLALQVASTLSQVKYILDRLVEIQQLTDPDRAVRQIAQARYQPKSKVLIDSQRSRSVYDKAAELNMKAATAQLRQQFNRNPSRGRGYTQHRGARYPQQRYFAHRNYNDRVSHALFKSQGHHRGVGRGHYNTQHHHQAQAGPSQTQ